MQFRVLSWRSLKRGFSLFVMIPNTPQRGHELIAPPELHTVEEWQHET